MVYLLVIVMGRLTVLEPETDRLTHILRGTRPPETAFLKNGTYSDRKSNSKNLSNLKNIKKNIFFKWVLFEKMLIKTWVSQTIDLKKPRPIHHYLVSLGRHSGLINMEMFLKGHGTVHSIFNGVDCRLLRSLHLGLII